MDTPTKTRENRLRRVAERRGLTLQRSRRRDPHALDYGTYYISSTTGLLTDEKGISLDDVETWLDQQAAVAR